MVSLPSVSTSPPVKAQLRLRWVLLLILLWVHPLDAQCPAGIYAPPGSSLTSKSYSWENEFVALHRIGNYYMPLFGGGHSMSETFWSGVDDNYHPYGSDG